MLGLNPISGAAISSAVSESTTPPGSLSLTGIVSVAGVPLVSCTVRLYDRASGALVDSTTTNGSGIYAFTTGLAGTSEAYFILAFDPSGGTTYNIGRLDRLTAGV